MQVPDPDALKPDREEQVSVKELVRDERTHKILGTLLLLICLFLFVAFSSYLFTWEEDQSAVLNSSVLFPDPDIKIANMLGSLGAWVSHQFFYNGFGIASYLFCLLFFAGGVNALTGTRQYPIWRSVRYVLAGVLFFSTVFAFFGQRSIFPWGGGVGMMVAEWLERTLGWLGTLALLAAVALAFVIWKFNPSFRRAARPEVVAGTGTMDDTGAMDSVENEEEVEEAESFAGNKLRKSGAGQIQEEPRKVASQDASAPFLTESGTDDPSATEEAEELEDEIGPAVQRTIPVTPLLMEEFPVAGAGDKQKNHPPPEPELVINEAAEEPEETEEQTGAITEEPYEPTLELRNYRMPTIDLLEVHGSEKIVQDAAELEANKNQIITTLRNYDILIQKISATVGPTVTLYEIVPAAGIRISRIKNLEDDIALSLAALGIRIIAPIPGKGTIGIEVPNVKKTVVSMRTLLNSEKFQHNNYSLPIALGKKIDNENFIVDLTTMPHLLMAGATGQGKSVGLNAILVSLLYKKHPSQLKLVLVDPKKVELSLYRTIEKHFLAKLPGEEEAIITDTKKVIHTLNALCIEMDNRYDLLKEAGARNIREYNEKFVRRRLNPQKGHQFLPFIVLVIDEFADLIMTAGKEVEMPIARLAQLARAVGIHLIIATQRPSVNIITGTIKANFPARIAFKVSSKIDSRTILDTGGAEQLIGKGDMLVSYNGEITRLQCAFVDTPEVDRICDYIGKQQGYAQAFLLPEYVDEKEMENREFSMLDRDPLFEDAARLIVQNQVGSTSLIQRRMKLGYNRAGRLMDQLEAAGVVGPTSGSKPRDVLIKTEAELEQHLLTLG